MDKTSVAKTYRQALHESMTSALQTVPQSFLYGLGVDDQTGIFGTTKGLREKYGPQRVFNTPICEDSMVGFGIGASLGGMYPINIHIRNDFLLLAMNQIANSAAKYNSMYGGLFKVPFFIRAVIGRSWGQGAQHSQALHSVFSHFPGLKVIMPATASHVTASYEKIIGKYQGPVISLEHRSLYDLEFNPTTFHGDFTDSQILKSGKDLTLVSLSYPAIQSLYLAQLLEKHGLSAEVIDLHSPSHFSRDLILQSLKKTKKLIVIDVGWTKYGIAGELAKLALENQLQLEHFQSLGSPETPCPTSHALEKYFYPQTTDIARAMMHAHFKNRSDSPSGDKIENILSEIKPLEKKQFKGPF